MRSGAAARMEHVGPFKMDGILVNTILEGRKASNHKTTVKLVNHDRPSFFRCFRLVRTHLFSLQLSIRVSSPL